MKCVYGARVDVNGRTWIVNSLTGRESSMQRIAVRVRTCHSGGIESPPRSLRNTLGASLRRRSLHLLKAMLCFTDVRPMLDVGLPQLELESLHG